MKNRWISCLERLPEEGIDVLVTRTYTNRSGDMRYLVDIAELYRDGDGYEWIADMDKYIINKVRYSKPIAWMELPEPYREE